MSDLKIKSGIWERILTSDKDLLDNVDYKKVVESIQTMIETGVPFLGAGYCISVSEMIRSALDHRGIKSKIFECNLTLTYFNFNPPKSSFIGFANIKDGNEVDTHVVVITETNPPLLIDASIEHRLPNGMSVILDKADIFINPLENKKLGDYHFENHNLKATYENKNIQKIPYLLQNSIIDRINTDKKIFNNIEYLKRLNYIGIGLSVFAVIAVINQFLNFYQ